MGPDFKSGVCNGNSKMMTHKVRLECTIRESVKPVRKALYSSCQNILTWLRRAMYFSITSWTACWAGSVPSVMNQLMTCGSRPNTVPPEPSPTYNHPPDPRPATHTQRVPIQALADHAPCPMSHRALSVQPNNASVPVLIWRRPRNLPQPSARTPLCGVSSGFSHHVGSIAAILFAMTPVQLVLTPVQLTDTHGLTPLISLEL
jgi:hypothetical protein